MSRVHRQLDKVIDLLEAIDVTLDRLYRLYKSQLPGTSALTLTLPGGDTMSVVIGTTDAIAVVQFADASGNPGAGPNDSVTGEPIVPVLTSADTGVATFAAGLAGAEPGQFTYALTTVAVGTYSASIEPLTNSDGSAVVDSAGNPYTLAGPDTGTITGAPTTQATLTLP